MTDNNAADFLREVKVPKNFTNAQGFIDYLKEFAEQGKQVGTEDFDAYLAHLSATVVEIVHSLGVREAAADNLKQSVQNLGGLFKPKPKSE